MSPYAWFKDDGSNVSVAAGALHLKANPCNPSYLCRIDENSPYKTYNYSSGWVASNALVRFGYFEKLKKGKGEVIIQGSELKSGLYIYSLIVDGKEIDSKRMILTR
jgi:hypothetical protein